MAKMLCSPLAIFSRQRRRPNEKTEAPRVDVKQRDVGIVKRNVFTFHIKLSYHDIMYWNLPPLTNSGNIFYNLQLHVQSSKGSILVGEF